MGRNGSFDENAYGAQNAGRLREALSRPVDPRLVEAPSTEAGREEETQRASIAYLRSQGVIVLETSVRYRLVECERCHHTFRWHGDTGQSPGIPDTLVRVPDWPVPAVWVGVEMKGRRTKVSEAQRDLCDGGHIYIARTVAQAVAYVTSTTVAMEGRG